MKFREKSQLGRTPLKHSEGLNSPRDELRSRETLNTSNSGRNPIKHSEGQNSPRDSKLRSKETLNLPNPHAQMLTQNALVESYVR